MAGEAEGVARGGGVEKEGGWGVEREREEGASAVSHPPPPLTVETHCPLSSCRGELATPRSSHSHSAGIIPGV